MSNAQSFKGMHALTEQRATQRAAQRIQPYRASLPSEALRRVQPVWEAQVEGSDTGVPYFFSFAEDGTPLYRLYGAPREANTPVAAFDGWDTLAFRPWYRTWTEVSSWVSSALRGDRG